MLDLKWIREQPDQFDAAMQRRGADFSSKSILALDEQVRALQTEIQALQAEGNTIAKDIPAALKRGEDIAPIKERGKEIKDKIAAMGGEVEAKQKALADLLATIPNAPAADVPQGKDESENQELRVWGDKPKFDFAPKMHDDIGVALGMMDFEKAAQMSGARFVVLKGQLARLERALASFFLDHNTTAYGFEEVAPPFMVRDSALYGTAQLPKFEEDLYERSSEVQKKAHELVLFANQTAATAKHVGEINKIYHSFLGRFNEAAQKNAGNTSWAQPLIQEFVDCINGYANFDKKNAQKIKEMQEFGVQIAQGGQTRHYLIPTSEVPLTNLVADSILTDAELPLRYTAYTPCFRSEAGSAGRDTRGMIRQHQFSKVEMVCITTPEQSAAEHERMTECAESLLQQLGIPYRVVVLCTGDMGFAATKTYDIEAWMPGQDAYREISSCSNCGDFQARRMKARFRAEGEKQTQFVHTLNGSGLPIGRTMVAIIENYQQADGSIRVPDALVPYMGGLTVIGAKA
jgi:seryl-tRNA synthetase